ncbi:hypothetical protein D3C87_1692790 [compost metagenome]
MNHTIDDQVRIADCKAGAPARHHLPYPVRGAITLWHTVIEVQFEEVKAWYGQVEAWAETESFDVAFAELVRGCQQHIFYRSKRQVGTTQAADAEAWGNLPVVGMIAIDALATVEPRIVNKAKQVAPIPKAVVFQRDCLLLIRIDLEIFTPQVANAVVHEQQWRLGRTA